MVPLSLLYPPFPPLIHEGFDLILHIVIGYTVARVWLGLRGLSGALGGLAPNLDYPLQHWTPVPVVHGGIFHTPAFLLVLLGGGYVIFRSDTTLLSAFAAGYLLELVVDTLQHGGGIMWLYPVTTFRIATPIPGSELYWGSLFYLGCFYLLYKHETAKGTPEKVTS